MNVLSLFDGISCAQVALKRNGVKVDNYYASELDRFAIQITQGKHPETIQLGDVTKWGAWDIDWSSIDLVSAGFPCQSWSLAGKQLPDNYTLVTDAQGKQLVSDTQRYKALGNGFTVDVIAHIFKAAKL